MSYFVLHLDSFSVQFEEIIGYNNDGTVDTHYTLTNWKLHTDQIHKKINSLLNISNLIKDMKNITDEHVLIIFNDDIKKEEIIDPLLKDDIIKCYDNLEDLVKDDTELDLNINDIGMNDISEEEIVDSKEQMEKMEEFIKKMETAELYNRQYTNIIQRYTREISPVVTTTKSSKLSHTD